MKILILQDFLRGGGTEQQVIFLAQYFKNEGHDVVLLTFRPAGPLEKRLANTGIRRVSLQKNDLGLSFFAPGIFGALRREAPDTILCMGRMANYYAGLIQKRLRDIPVVGSVRTGKRLTFLYGWSLGQVRAIIVNSRWWRDRLKRKGIDPRKVRLIYNSMVLPLEGRTGSEERSRFRKRYGAGPAHCVFLNVANFRSGKRHRRLIRIFSNLRESGDWQLWLVGQGRELNRCRKAARSYGIEERVRFFYFKDDPGPFYAASDVAVSASIEDSLPNFVIEAQAAGLPVIASDTGGVGESFSPGSSGFLIPADDDDAFHRALVHLKADRPLRESFGRSGREFARNRFSGRERAEEVLKFLLEISPTSAGSGRAEDQAVTVNPPTFGKAQPFTRGHIYLISGWRKVVFWPLYFLLRFYLSTLRFRGSTETMGNLTLSSEAMLYLTWHRHILVTSEFLRRYRDAGRIYSMVSPSRFAAWLEAFLSEMGFVTVRGSSSRRSIAATRELVAANRAGNDVAITPDGPSGPRFKFKRGALFLARVTDAPILIGGATAAWVWQLRSWDRQLIPFPFSKVHLSVHLCPRYSSLEANSEEAAASFLKSRLMDVTEPETKPSEL